MRVLIVASYNSNHFSPFVLEQVEAIVGVGIEVGFFGVLGKGILGYLSNRNKLLNKISVFQPDIIHAHYGLSGLLANLQNEIPVITTYHGSDIHSNRIILLISRVSMRLSKFNIFVSERLYSIAKYSKKNYSVLSCGLNLELLNPIDIIEARMQLGWNYDKVYILFAGAFDNLIKNYSLAKASVERIENCELVELKGYTRAEVNVLMNACNLLLTTSFQESGPLVVKEAMACNRPIVSTDVGDVRWIIGDTEGCYITSFDSQKCADQIKEAIKFSIERKETKGRERVLEIELDNRIIARKLVAIYDSVLDGSIFE